MKTEILLNLNRFLMSHTEISNLIVGVDWNVIPKLWIKKVVFLGDQLYMVPNMSLKRKIYFSSS